MSTMDFGIPDLSPGRDTAPDATRRRGKTEPSDFAALLDRAVDEPDDHARPQELDDRRPAANGADRQREKTSWSDRSDVDDQTHRDEPSGDTEPAAQTATPAPQPNGEQLQEPSQDASDTAQPAAQAGNPDAGAVAGPEQATGDISSPAATGTAATTADAGAIAKPTKSADVAPPAAVNAAPPAPTAPLSGGTEAAAPAAEAAQPVPTDPSAAPSPSFADQLAVATGKAADTTAAKAGKSDAMEAAPKPQMPGDAAPAVAVPPVADATNSNAQQNFAQGNPAQPAAAPSASQDPAPVAAVAVAPAPAGSDAQSATADESTSGDAALLAVMRAANAQSQASTRASESKPAETPASIDPMLEGVEIDTKPAAEPAKAETASKPFGALAPGLGLAAQITSQQTPEQATAADRLAQLAAAIGEQAEEMPEQADAQKPADVAAAPAKQDQPAPTAEAPAHRPSVAEAGNANAAARAARPHFHPAITQVAAQMVQAAADGTDRINIRLSPAELGRIDVKLDFGPDGRVQAVFAAERPQTMELLQRDARDLERALQDAGLRADSGSLSFNLRGQGRDGQGEQTPNGSGKNHAPTELAASQLQAYAAGSGGPGRLDIRI